MSFIGVQLARKHALRDAAEIQEEAITVRPSSTAVFGVDSDDRYANYSQRRTSPSYPFSFRITKPEALLNGFFKRLAVTEFRMYWTLPNISPVWGNNTLTYFENVTPATHTITIPTGFYDLQDLMLTIEALVQAQGFLPNFIAQANLDGTTSYGTGDANLFNWVPPTSTTRTLYDMLNLVNTLPAPTPATTQQGGIANLKSTDYIDIISPQLTYNQDLKDGSTAPIVRDMLVRIYLDESCKPIAPPSYVSDTAPPVTNTPTFTNGNDVNGVLPFVIYRQFPHPKQILWNNTQSIGNVTFEMYDDQGRSIQSLWTSVFAPSSATGFRYANSFVWNMTLLVSEN